VDTDDKKNDCFMIGLSTKLQEHMALNMGGAFLEFFSNVIITDDAICTHKEAKKRKVVAAPSGSALHGTEWCAITAPPTRLVSSNNTSVNSSSGLPIHLSASTSRQHPGLYFHHR
jgi:hypothetical protein